MSEDVVQDINCINDTSVCVSFSSQFLWQIYDIICELFNILGLSL